MCGVCGADPCYRICPTQDPFGGDQAAEAADHDFNAQYDDVRERYMEHCPRHGAYAGDCGGCEAEHYANEDDDEPYVHYCEGCGKDDTHMEEGCPCRNGAALPSMTVGAVLNHKRQAAPADDDIPF